MPYSLVVNLVPRAPIPKTHLSGRHLHALFLDLVKSVDQELASVLHGQTEEKAFTLSPLQVQLPDRKSHLRNSRLTDCLQFQYNRSIPEGTPCWWRISLLDDHLFQQLTQLWLGLHPNQPWYLGGTELDVVSVLGTPQPEQPWAGVSSYEQLLAQASPEERSLTLQFCTPTTFRKTKYDCAMPTKEVVFQSLLRRWNRYSNATLTEEILEPIYPSYFNIHTEIVIDSRSKFIGCVGVVTFQILGEVESETIQKINALADFAFYAGVGRKTPMGMGMVRRYPT
jgi:CRISPR-associated endoribonuclease Cas6